MPQAHSTRPPLFSVVIPLHRDGPRFRRCLDACLAMQGNIPYEVVVVADRRIADLPEQVTHVVTGMPPPTSPALKRDVGAGAARGAVLAFIDDDAYPDAHWLDAAATVLADQRIHGVGGPGLTPPDGSRSERLGGAIYESRLGSGPLRHRFVPGSQRAAVDLPAYNLIIRRAALEAVEGWKSTFYGGEDTKVCAELVAAGFKLLYDPRLVVYHHRRPFLRPHLRQVANVGRHRGYFFRRHPATSRYAFYLLPTCVLMLSTPMAVLVGTTFRASPRAAGAILLAGWLGLSAPRFRGLGLAAFGFPLLLAAHHLAYGVSFLRGLCESSLDGDDR